MYNVRTMYVLLPLAKFQNLCMEEMLFFFRAPSVPSFFVDLVGEKVISKQKIFVYTLGADKFTSGKTLKELFLI